MTGLPGQITDEEQRAWIDRFRRMAVELWGDTRSAAIDATLVEAATATGAILAVELVRDEPPGFYLAPNFDEINREWKIG